jgi:glycosyltransferase involved in cell wall biosynthesis
MLLDAIETRPRRILMSADAMGGVWTYSLQLAQGLSRLGIEVHLAVLGPAPSPSQRHEARRIRRLEVIVPGLPLDWTADSETALAEVPAALKSLALGTRADLVHLNAPAHAGIAPWPLPLVVAAHSCVATWWRSLNEVPLPEDLAWRARRTGAGLKVADAIVAPSQSFARALAGAYGAGLPVITVPNGRQRKDGASRQQKSHVLTAGRLWDPAKNVGTIDEAARISGALVHAAGPTCGPNGEQVCFPHLAMLGALSDTELARWHDSAAVFVSASRYEPFGLAVLEAAQAGAALVLSDIETFRELWDGAALFLPAGEPGSFAEALQRLSADGPLRRQLAHRAQARARHWSAERMLAATLSVYARVLKAHAGHEPPRSAA